MASEGFGLVEALILAPSLLALLGVLTNLYFTLRQQKGLKRQEIQLRIREIHFNRKIALVTELNKKRMDTLDSAAEGLLLLRSQLKAGKTAEAYNTLFWYVEGLTCLSGGPDALDTLEQYLAEQQRLPEKTVEEFAQARELYGLKLSTIPITEFESVLIAHIRTYDSIESFTVNELEARCEDILNDCLDW